MSRTAAVYESTFAKSAKTDAILVVDGKKLHVNKALLSYHSDYFAGLFNSTPAAEEFQIDDVKFEDFATLLSLIQHNPLKVTDANSERLLILGEHFQIPAAKRHVESFLITVKKEKFEKIRIADRYQLDDLLGHALFLFKTNVEFRDLRKNATYKALSDKTKVAICHRFWDMTQY